MSFWSVAMGDGGEKDPKGIRDKKDENDKSAKKAEEHHLRTRPATSPVLAVP